MRCQPIRPNSKPISFKGAPRAGRMLPEEPKKEIIMIKITQGTEKDLFKKMPPADGQE